MVFRLNSFPASNRTENKAMKLQFRLLIALPKDIVTIGGKLNGAYARNMGRSYTKTAYDRVRRQQTNDSSNRSKKNNYSQNGSRLIAYWRAP